MIEYKSIHNYTINLGLNLGEYILNWDFDPANSGSKIPCRVKVTWGNTTLDTGFRGSSEYDVVLNNLGYGNTLGDQTSGHLILNKNEETPTTATITLYTPIEESLAKITLECEAQNDSDSDIPTESLPPDVNVQVTRSGVLNPLGEPSYVEFRLDGSTINKQAFSVSWSVPNTIVDGYKVYYSFDNGLNWNISPPNYKKPLEVIHNINNCIVGVGYEETESYLFKVCSVVSGSEFCSEVKSVNFLGSCGAYLDDNGNCTLPDGCCGVLKTDYAGEFYCEYPDYTSRPECCPNGICPGEIGSGGGIGEACGFCGEWTEAIGPYITQNSKGYFCRDECQIRPFPPTLNQWFNEKPTLNSKQMMFYNEIMSKTIAKTIGKIGGYCANRVADPNAFSCGFTIPPINDFNLYSQYNKNDGINASITRNNSCWLSNVENISCWSSMKIHDGNGPEYDAPNLMPAILITKKHCVFATHYTPIIGTDFIFVDELNNQCRVKLIETKLVFGDLTIGKFDQEVTSNIKITKILPGNLNNHIHTSTRQNVNRRAGIQFTPLVIAVNQNHQAGILRWGDHDGGFSRVGAATFQYRGIADYLDYVSTFELGFPAPGDSGTPVFILIENELVFLGSWFSPGTISPVSLYINLCNDAIEYLSPGEGYSVTQFDLDEAYDNMVSRNVSSVLNSDYIIPGCTNHYASNFNSYATCDDGSCETCCNQSLCVINDLDERNNFNQMNINFDNLGPHMPSFSSQGSPGCCDAACLDWDDCAPSFSNSFVATMCDGSTITYHSCQECQSI